MKIPVCFPIVTALFCATLSPAQEAEKPHAEMREKMQKVKKEIGELRAGGHHDEAKRLEERIREGMGKKEGGQPERMQHIHEAIKHLRAAGLNEPAERIEQMAREHQKADGGERRQAGPNEGMEQMQRALRETHEQMAKMARAIEELREQLGKREKHE